mmetsp:Transcript_86699/g.280690  ORF Transcript_86699/g.280690 Transcript_86699/m.280690 type:complete len:274 (-) Transcript_86699:219-1040(-)
MRLASAMATLCSNCRFRSSRCSASWCREPSRVSCSALSSLASCKARSVAFSSCWRGAFTTRKSSTLLASDNTSRSSSSICSMRRSSSAFFSARMPDEARSMIERVPSSSALQDASAEAHSSLTLCCSAARLSHSIRSLQARSTTTSATESCELKSTTRCSNAVVWFCNSDNLAASDACCTQTSASSSSHCSTCATTWLSSERCALKVTSSSDPSWTATSAVASSSLSFSSNSAPASASCASANFCFFSSAFRALSLSKCEASDSSASERTLAR